MVFKSELPKGNIHYLVPFMVAHRYLVFQTNKKGFLLLYVMPVKLFHFLLLLEKGKDIKHYIQVYRFS